MIIISEVTHTGEVHFQVNSCFVEMISVLYPNQKVIFTAEDKHSAAVKGNLGRKEFHNLHFLPFKGYYDEKKFNWGTKIIGECIQITKTLKLGKLHSNDLYIWTCLFPTGHFFLNFLTLFQSKPKHIIVLHGELEYLKFKNKRSTEKIFGLILKSALNLSTKKTKYIVLGNNIKKKLDNIISDRISKRTYSILHPYNFSTDVNLMNLNNNKVLTIGSIGTQMLSKNSHFIYNLAEYFRDDIVQNNIKFKTIGRVLKELDHCETDLVEKVHSDSFVSQKQFELEISKLNFVVFFYDNSAYELCASGAIFEVIRLGVPIISLNNNFFQWLFESFGDMGFLCDNLEDMNLVIKELKEGKHKQNLEDFRNNITQFKIKNSLENIAFNLKAII